VWCGSTATQPPDGFAFVANCGNGLKRNAPLKIYQCGFFAETGIFVIQFAALTSTI
jgi:hypothetical protein